MTSPDRRMSGRQKRALDNAPKLRKGPRVATPAIPRQQLFTCLFFVEGEADRNFLEYCRTVFPAGPDLRIVIHPVSGGDLQKYGHAWKHYYNGEPSAVFVFDADLHPVATDELPEDCARRRVREILELLYTREELQQHMSCWRDALIRPKAGQTRPKRIVQALRFSPCLEGQLLAVLGKDAGTVSANCKKSLANECAQRLGGGQHPEEVLVQNISPAQWQDLFPKDLMESACKRLPELTALRRILHAGW